MTTQKDPFDVSIIQHKAKLEVLCRALGVKHHKQVLRKFVKIKDDVDRLSNRLKTIKKAGGVRSVRTIELFEYFATEKVEENKTLQPVFVNKSGIDLATATIEEFVSLLQEPFATRYQNAIARDKDSPDYTGGLTATFHENWKDFDTLMRKVTRGSGGTDLRIATLSFSNEKVPEKLFLDLTNRGIRTRVLLTNPTSGRELVHMRHKLREDGTAQKGTMPLIRQLKDLTHLKRKCDNLPSSKHKGSFDFHVSSVMPYGFVALTAQFAVMGLFLADRSYDDGPMIVIDAKDNSTVWKSLAAEWDKRWKAASEESAAELRGEELQKFFGGASHIKPGAITLQTDSLEYLVKGWGDSALKRLNGKHTPFKTRRWLNRCEVLGAQAIVAVFGEYNCEPPALLYEDPNLPRKEDDSYPFKISMGGFSLIEKKDVGRLFQGWLQAIKRTDPDAGFTVLLHKGLLPTGALKTEKDKEPFERLLPRDWQPKAYMRQWVRKLTEYNVESVEDFALIIRWTDERLKQVKWFCLGFTEVGTQAAGEFLSKHWYEKYYLRHSTQDFISIIRGDSDPYKTRTWEEVLFKTRAQLSELGLAFLNAETRDA